eukprot:6491745-Amphidinium_carterae.3
MVSPAVKEAWEGSDWGEMNYVGIVCYALHASPESTIDVKRYPQMKSIPVLLRCMSKRHEQMGSRIGEGVPSDMRYWHLLADEKQLLLRVGHDEARFPLWLPSMEGCTITDQHIMEKCKLHSPKFGIEVSCLQLIMSGDYGDARGPVEKHLVSESTAWDLPEHVLKEPEQAVAPEDSMSVAPSAAAASTVSKRRSLSDIECRLKSKARSSTSGSVVAQLPP